MRIGFIFPSSHYLFDPFRGDPFTHFQLLTILEDTFRDKVELLLIDLRGISREFAIQHIPECDIYLHSIYTLDYSEQKDLVDDLRKVYPGAIHVAGGPHANVYPEESLQVFDVLVLGEGEKAIIQIVEDVMQGRRQVLYRQMAPIDINAYPHFRRHFLPKTAIGRKNFLTLKNQAGFDQILGTTAMFSRGCPYRCHFCAIGEVRGARPIMRYRSPEHVEKEINYLKQEYRIEGLNIVDEIGIPLKREQAIAHLEAIGHGNIVWRGQCRVDGITPELADLAHESGCIALGLGVESVSQKSLDIINKKIRVEDARRTIRLLKTAGIEARIYLIIGLPGEPDDIVEKTWTFLQETEPDLVYLSLFTVRPGTEVFNHPENFGIEYVNTDWEKTMHQHSSKERPELTLRYKELTPWGRSITSKKIVDNYLELLGRLQAAGLNSFEFNNPKAKK